MLSTIIRAGNNKYYSEQRLQGRREWINGQMLTYSSDEKYVKDMIHIQFLEFNIDGKGSALIERLEAHKSSDDSLPDVVRKILIIPSYEVREILEGDKFYVDF